MKQILQKISILRYHSIYNLLQDFFTVDVLYQGGPIAEPCTMLEVLFVAIVCTGQSLAYKVNVDPLLPQGIKFSVPGNFYLLYKHNHELKIRPTHLIEIVYM